MPGKMRKVSIYIPEAMAAFFEKYAYHRGISRSEAIRECLRGVLSFLEDSRLATDMRTEEEIFEELLRKAKAEGRLIG
jgi:metal-responsive CopG/Arc/MetJ family transcriptional regulator